MRPALPAAACLTLLLAVGARAAVVPLDPATYVRLGASVLMVEAPRVQGGYAVGSSVIVAPETVVTNCHVTRDAREISVLQGGLRFAADAQASDIERDLCLLRVPGLPAPAVPIGRSATMHIGEPVAALGYSAGAGLQQSPGEVVELHRFDDARVIQSSAAFNSGASGGALFDGQGRLVGILTFRLRGGHLHYFAAPAEWIAALLASPPRVPFVAVGPAPRTRRAFWQAPPDHLPRFLRAKSMQLDRRWLELETLTADWAREQPDDGEPWFLRGTALEQLGRRAEARQVLACALVVDPVGNGARLQRSGPPLDEDAPTLAATTGVCR
jgi:serine protease Do